MPYPFYKILTPGDLDAVVAYMRTVAPVRNEVQPPNYKAAMHAELIPGGEKPIGTEKANDPIKRGLYLATSPIAWNAIRASPMAGRTTWTGWGKGGHEMKGPFGRVKVSNITSHREKGIGAWTDDEIRKALTQGMAATAAPSSRRWRGRSITASSPRRTSTPSSPGCGPFRRSSRADAGRAL